MKTIAMTVLCVLFAAGSALAQGKSDAKKPAEAKGAAPAAAPAADAKMEPAKPAPELDTLKWMEGTWKCEGKMAAGAMGPGTPEMAYKSKMMFKRDKSLGNFAFNGSYEMLKSKTNPAVKASFLAAYDTTSKQFVNMGVDSMGGIVRETSTGMTGDKMVFNGEGTMMGMKIKTRNTITKKSDKELTYTAEADMTGKGFIQMGEDTCKK